MLLPTTPRTTGPLITDPSAAPPISTPLRVPPHQRTPRPQRVKEHLLAPKQRQSSEDGLTRAQPRHRKTRVCPKTDGLAPPALAFGRGGISKNRYGPPNRGRTAPRTMDQPTPLETGLAPGKVKMPRPMGISARDAPTACAKTIAVARNADGS